MSEGVLVGGKYCPLSHPITGHPIQVYGPGDHGMAFEIGDGYNKRRRVDITLGVYHWTGSENPVETMFGVLNRRKLGVEFAITPLGNLFQFCDPVEVDTADAGAANKISFGVEVINQGTRKWNKWKTPRSQTRSGFDLGPRPAYDTIIHDKSRKCWGFYPAQTATMCAFNRLMVDAIPTYEAGVCTEPGVIDWADFRGAIGHLNIKRSKIDPGTQPMKKLAAYMNTGLLL